jgi:hypothetical protein
LLPKIEFFLLLLQLFFTGESSLLLSVESNVIDLFKLSDEGDCHILLNGWKAMLSGNKGPAVALKSPPGKVNEPIKVSTFIHSALAQTVSPGERES